MCRDFRRAPGDIRKIVVAMLIAVLLLGPHGGSMAQRSGDGRYQVTRHYDLPAMALFPQDYGVEGMRYFAGHILDSDEYADYLAGESGGDPDSYVSRLEDGGFTGAYRLTSTTLSGETDLTVKADGWVIQFNSADDAAMGFELVQEAHPDGEAVDAPETGDQSILLVNDTARNTGNDSLRMDYIIRVGNFVGVASMTWSGDSVGEAFGADEMADVAKVLETRMEDGISRDTAGLSVSVLRPAESRDYSVNTYDEGYLEIDGEYVRTIWYSQILQDVADFWDEQGIEAVYWSASELTSPDSDGSEIIYVVRAYRLEDEDRADSFLSESMSYFGSVEGTYSGIEEIGPLPELGHNAQGVAYEYNAGTSAATEGYRVWFVVDGLVYSVEADAPEGVDLERYLEVVEAQIGCAETNYCAPMEFPADLAQ